MLRVSWVEDDPELTVTCAYAQDYVTRLRKIPGAHFVREGESRYWRVPKDQLDQLEELFRGELIFQTPAWMIRGEAPPPLPKWMRELPDDPIPGMVGPELLPHQRQGANWAYRKALECGYAHDWDDVGLGKTATALAFGELMLSSGKLRRPLGLIVVLASLRHQWLTDGVEKFTTRRAAVLEPGAAKRQRVYAEAAAGAYDYLILSYELLRLDWKLLAQLKVGFAIIDEAHEKLLSTTGKTHVALRRLKIPYRLFLTGSPIGNNPEELRGLWDLCDRNFFGKAADFRARYVRVDWSPGYPKVIGFRHLDELQNKIEGYYIRRTRWDLDLPFPKVQRIIRRTEPTAVQVTCHNLLMAERDRLSDDLRSLRLHNPKPELILQRENQLKALVSHEMFLTDSPLILSQSSSLWVKRNLLMDLVQDTSSPKLEMLVSMLTGELLPAGEKVVIFTQSKRMALLIRETVQHLAGTALIVGGMKETDKEAERFRFNRDPATQILVCTPAIKAGVNLPAARICIHYDLPWNPTTLEQREGRITRLDSPYSEVVAYVLMVDGLIDEQVWNTLQRKEAVVDQIIPR